MSENAPPTAEVVANFLEKLNQQDADGIAACFAADIDWYVPGDASLPWVGRRSHQNQVAAYFRTMWLHYVPGQSSATLEKLITAGNDAMILGQFAHTVASNGRSLRSPVAMHLLVADGKIVKLHLYEDTLAVSRALAQ